LLKLNYSLYIPKKKEKGRKGCQATEGEVETAHDQKGQGKRKGKD